MKLRKYFLVKKEDGTFKLLRDRFGRRSEELLSEFEDKHKGTLKWLAKKSVAVERVVAKGSRGALAGLAAGFVMLSSGLGPHGAATNRTEQTVNLDIGKTVAEIKARLVLEQTLKATLYQNLPQNVSALTNKQADLIAKDLSAVAGVKMTAELDGNRLNTNYGKIGLEQHLPRYPGETIFNHFDSVIASNRYGQSGMTSGRGALGYFANNAQTLTPESVQEEKYYVVVQTFAIPDWGKKKGLSDWYKHRKVVVINTENGKAVVGDIADSGPAKWTGKSFGGSPELMDQLGMYKGDRKAKVLIFFLDDNTGEIKLGPI